ncbi:MAG: ABC transporter ATP-binding protein [Sporolactobacillus sp.]
MFPLFHRLQQLLRQRDLRQAIHFLAPYLRSHWKAYFILAIAMLADIGITIAFASFLGAMTNAAVGQHFDKVKQLIPAGVGLLLGQLIITYANAVFANHAAQAIQFDMKNNLLKHLLLQPVSTDAAQQSGTLLSHFTNDMQGINGAVGSNLIDLFRLPLMALAVFCYLLHISVQLSLIGVLIIPFAVVGGSYLGLLLRRNSRRIYQSMGQANSLLNDIFHGKQVIHAFLAEGFFFRRYQQANRQLYQFTSINAHLQGIYSAGGEFVGLIAYLASLFLGAWLVAQGKITIGALLAFMALINQLIFPLNSLAGRWSIFQQALAAAERIHMLLDQPLPASEWGKFTAKPPLKRGIEIKHLTFGYETKRPILRDLNLTIPAGTMTAIVGPSGAGKTTFLRLLQRFYSPTSGQITIDGQPADTMSSDEQRSYIAEVPQDTYLFSGTIRENLLLANRSASEAEMIRAAKAAFIHSFICALPDGYETRVGEGGLNLSGGQKQRLSIARALLKNAPILLLDEATSALDAETEQQIKRTLEEQKGTRTLIVVAHRLSTIRGADQIVVLSHGRIVESGTHAHLIHTRGLYYQLSSQQETPWEKTRIPIALRK